MSNLKWGPILDRARDIVNSYDTGVTLRQLFYRLVSEQWIPNTKSMYGYLSAKTAKARRDGWFPDLLERGREIYRRQSFSGIDELQRHALSIYGLDRSKNQPWNIYLGVEKAGMLEQLWRWFGHLGVRIFAAEGYASQTQVSDICDQLLNDGRQSLLIYAGDFDPSGEDIYRDVVERTMVFAKTVQVALTSGQVMKYQLPESIGKTTDTRAKAFEAKHGRLVQVELDALDPNILRQLYQDALDQCWDDAKYQEMLRREQVSRQRLARLWGN